MVRVTVAPVSAVPLITGVGSLVSPGLVICAAPGAWVSTRKEALAATCAWLRVALLPAPSRIVPLLSARLLAAMLIPSASVSPATTV